MRMPRLLRAWPAKKFHAVKQPFEAKSPCGFEGFHPPLRAVVLTARFMVCTALDVLPGHPIDQNSRRSQR